jgi:hypothetical protein
MMASLLLLLPLLLSSATAASNIANLQQSPPQNEPSATAASSLANLQQSPPPTDPSLYPHLANGHLGTTVQTDELYVPGLFVNDVEYLIAACLSAPIPAQLLKLINPQGRYELSGLCQRLDNWVMEDPRRDVVEHGSGGRKARLSNPYAYEIFAGVSKVEETSVSYDLGSAIAELTASSSDGLSITRSYYAHRTVPQLYVHSLKVTPASSSSASASASSLLTFKHKTLRGLPVDIDFNETTIETGTVFPSVCESGFIAKPENEYAKLEKVAICYHTLPSTLLVGGKLGKEIEMNFAFSIHTTLDGEGEDEILQNALADLTLAETSFPTLKQQHIDGWTALNSEGSINLTPPTSTSPENLLLSQTLQARIDATKNAILSSVSETSFPPSPGSASTSGYFGELNPNP